MKRRKAIRNMVLTGIGGGILFSAYKWYDWNKTPDLAYLEERRELLSALAETIIPATGIVGAREAGAGEFIITMIRDCTDRMSMNKFIDSLKSLEQHCSLKYNKPFTQCTATEQQSVMQLFEEKGEPYNGIVGKAQDKFLGQSFFATLKKYTVLGYCSSEAGATRGLAYSAVPGSYQGCIQMQPGQRAWATK